MKQDKYRIVCEYHSDLWVVQEYVEEWDGEDGFVGGWMSAHHCTAKGKEDLTKWKRNKPNEKYIHNKGYYLTWKELENLPKEE